MLARAVWHQERATFNWDSSLGQFKNIFSPYQPANKSVSMNSDCRINHIVEAPRVIWVYWETDYLFIFVEYLELTWSSGLRNARAILQVFLTCSPAFATSVFLLSENEWRADWFLEDSCGMKEPEMYFRVTSESSELQCRQICWRL